MKDIKVITRHTPSNYGSLLQSLATIIIIERYGFKCSIIDYQRKDERGLNAILSSIRKKREWNDNWIKKLIYISLRFLFEYFAQFKFDAMRLRHLKLTSKYETFEELSEIKADLFMTGSDQVWGPIMDQTYDEAYFLSFADKETKKVAYAASFGRTDFNEEIITKYRQMLSRYDEITVRERNAVELLDKWDIPCRGQVLDPTLLISAEEWNTLITKDISGKFVLVYQLHNNKDLNEYAKAFAKKVNLPLIRISPSFHQVFRGGKFVYLPDLDVFLSYLKNCTYLITDSFHGTAFAINFNKQFVEILPKNKTGSRNLSILNLTNLTDRIITDYSDFSITDRQVDYFHVNKIIEEERRKSIELLLTMIND